MGKPKIYIDGQSGTTGLQIVERIEARDDVELLRIDEDKRHDAAARRELIAVADLVFLCLPDEAAREAVQLAEGTDTRIIDASTAHRTSPGWVYGFPELGEGQRARIAAASRIANPGCHATGFIACVAPLVACGLLPADYPLSCCSLTGYSGGGKKTIATYEDPERDEELSCPGIYARGLAHKHLPEMQQVCGLAHAPAFLPVIDDYFAGMAVSITLHNRLLPGAPHARDLHEALAQHYEGARFMEVAPFTDEPPTLYAGELAGTNRLRVEVSGNAERSCLVALLDNLGKGASGAAVQNMNIVLGLPEETGLE